MKANELSIDDRIARVRSVLAAARRLADPADPLGREARRALPKATGLSLEGVELGLCRHLETHVSADDLGKLMVRAGSARQVHVVLSANVFVGVVRAVALAVAAAPSVRVRPSTREAVMAPLLCRALREQDGAASFELCDGIDASAGDEVHVYGRRETIAAIACEAPGVLVRGHGPGFGIALVDSRTAPAALAAERLSWDVIAFDQRGCTSPRMALFYGSVGDAEVFARSLADELEKRESRVPRGMLAEEERREQALYRQTVRTIGVCHAGSAFTVGLDLAPRALCLPPSGRHLHVARLSSPSELGPLVDPFRRAITCIGHDPDAALAAPLLSLARGARSVALGQMQTPALDGPVDLREMV